MNKFLKYCLILSFSAPLISSAQGSKVKSLLLSADKAISKNYEYLAEFNGNIKVELLRVQNLENDSTYSAIQISAKSSNTLTVNYLDPEDVRLFLKVLKKLENDQIVEAHGEVEYSTATNFQFRVSNKNALHKFYYEIIIDRRYPQTNYIFGIEGLKELIAALETGLRKINT